MTSQETQAIKQSMNDGYFLKGSKQPKESEINACLSFFSQMDFIRDTKEPETTNNFEKALVGVFYAVMDRYYLISGFDSDKGTPIFIINNIEKH